MRPLRLANDQVCLEVVPEFGARVTKLIDRQTGRDWLVPGRPVGSSADHAIYGGFQARGWDECFPTVAPCFDESRNQTLRDHGDLWGRPWDCRVEDTVLSSTLSSEVVRFSRQLKLDGRTVTATYDVANIGAETLTYMWSQHCLLATGPDDKIDLQGIGEMTVTGGAASGDAVEERQFRWPRLSDARPDLSRIEPISAEFYLKAYAPVHGQPNAVISGSKGAIAFSWSAQEMPYLGLWLDYGGWPDDCPVHQIAIEPTTAPADHLTAARASGQSRTLNPNDRHRWTITLALTPDMSFSGENHVE